MSANLDRIREDEECNIVVQAPGVEARVDDHFPHRSVLVDVQLLGGLSVPLSSSDLHAPRWLAVTLDWLGTAEFRGMFPWLIKDGHYSKNFLRRAHVKFQSHKFLLILV